MEIRLAWCYLGLHSSPGGRTVVARRFTAWARIHPFFSVRRTDERGSLKDVAFIEFDLVQAKQRQQLGAIILSLVMFLLMGDVRLDGRHHRFAHREAGIAFLPLEVGGWESGFVDPFRGAAFDMLEHFGMRKIRTITNEQMDVVFDPVNSEKRATQIADDAADEGIEPVFEFGCDEWGAAFGAEHGVVEVLGKGAWHVWASSVLRTEKKKRAGYCIPGIEIPGYDREPSGRR
jgi:hypothetical protein